LKTEENEHKNTPGGPGKIRDRGGQKKTVGLLRGMKMEKTPKKKKNENALKTREKRKKKSKGGFRGRVQVN